MLRVPPIALAQRLSTGEGLREKTMFKVHNPNDVGAGRSYHSALIEAEKETVRRGVGFIISELNLDLLVNNQPIATEGEPECKKMKK